VRRFVVGGVIAGTALGLVLTFATIGPATIGSVVSGGAGQQGALIFAGAASLFGGFAGALGGLLVSVFSYLVHVPFAKFGYQGLAISIGTLVGSLISLLFAIGVVRVVNVELNPWPYAVVTCLLAFVSTLVGLWKALRAPKLDTPT
jgi:hypothetical protein